MFHITHVELMDERTHMNRILDLNWFRCWRLTILNRATIVFRKKCQGFESFILSKD